MNLENENEVFVYWNDRRSRVSDYYKLNIKTGVPRLIARGPDIDSYEVIYGSVEDDEGYPVGVLTDVGIERVMYTYDKKSKRWSEHYRYTCQDPSFVPVALAGDGKWLVSGSKFGTNGNLIEDNDTNALYLYDPKTKEFSEKYFPVITALSGSGPAWFFLLSNELINAGNKLGLSNQESEILVNEIIKGLPELISDDVTYPDLISKVKSPKGTTEAGLNSLKNDSFDTIILNAIEKATQRSIELSKELKSE